MKDQRDLHIDMSTSIKRGEIEAADGRAQCTQVGRRPNENDSSGTNMITLERFFICTNALFPVAQECENSGCSSLRFRSSTRWSTRVSGGRFFGLLRDQLWTIYGLKS